MPKFRPAQPELLSTFYQGNCLSCLNGSYVTMKYQSSKNRSKFVREKGTFMQSGHNLSMTVSYLLWECGKQIISFEMFISPFY